MKLLMLMAVLAVPALAQDQLCPKCKTTGRIATSSKDDALERDVLFCSDRLKRDETKGLGWKPCSGCRAKSLAAEAQAEFDENAAKADEWLAQQAKIEKDLGVDLESIETEHFVLTWGMDSFTGEDRKLYTAHTGMHLFATRLETFYREFHETLTVPEEMLVNRKHHVFFFKDKKTLIKASQLYLGMTSDTSALAGGDPSLFASWWDKNDLRSDRDVHRHFVHHVSHLLLAVIHRKAMLDEYGFVHEGLAHYFEVKGFGHAGNSCNREQAEEHLQDVDFESQVARAVRAGNQASFATLSSKKTPDLNGIDHAYAWSFAEFLVSQSPKGMLDLILQLKDKKPLREAIKSVFGWTFTELEAAWLEHVKKTYREKDAGPRVRR